MHPRRPRLHPQAYIGLARYLVTCCTNRRHPFFNDEQTVTETLMAIRQSGREFQFAIVAYCFMPDHVHVVLEGTAENSDLCAYVHAMKQRAGFVFKKRKHRPLWQPSYHDHVLRDDQVTLKVVRYVLDNPVRARLVTSPRDYPFLGSDVYPLEVVLEAVGEIEESFKDPR